MSDKTKPGNFFEDFRLGQRIVHATPRTATEGDVALYTGLYGTRFAVNSSDPFAASIGLPRAPLDDMLAFHLVFGKTVPDVSLNAIANLGYAAGRFNAWLITPEIGPGARPGRRVDAKRLIPVGFVLLGIAVLEYFHYGPVIIRKFPIPALRESSVVNLPAGNATGSRWSGTYQVELEALESSGFVGKSGGQLEFVQQDGQLTVNGLGGMILRGGMDSNGRFWAGGQRQTGVESGTLRFLLTGRFQDTEVFTCSKRVTLLKGGRHVNSSREDGSGHRRR